MRTPYNIIVIKTDQQRADTLNWPDKRIVQTPHMDRLAERSVVFSNAFCCGATCITSRAAFYTGQYAVNTGIYRFDRWAHLPTWLDDFKRAGYHLASIGKNHHNPFDAKMAFDERIIAENFPLEEDWDDFSRYLKENNQPNPLRLLTQDGRWLEKCGADAYPLDKKYYVDTFIGDQSVQWLGRYDLSRPFFLHVGFVGPHDPFTVPRDYLDLYENAILPEPVDANPDVANKPRQHERFRQTVAEDEGWDRPPMYGANHIVLQDKSPADIQRMRKHYYAKISAIDEQVGRILDVLESRGLAENTIIVLTSDHGENLGDHGLVYKWLMTEQVVKIPMLIALPAAIRRTAVDGRLFSHIDTGPTLLDLCGITPQTRLDGRSNKERLLSGRDHTIPTEVYCFDNYLIMMRTDSEKLVMYSGQPYGEYYDIATDPFEERNLYAAHTNRVLQLKSRLLGWLSATRYLGSGSSDQRVYPDTLPNDPYRLA